MQPIGRGFRNPRLCLKELLPPVLDSVAGLVQAVGRCQRLLPLPRGGAVEVVLQPQFGPRASTSWPSCCHLRQLQEST